MIAAGCLDCNTPSQSYLCETCWAVRHDARFIADAHTGIRVTLPYAAFLKLRPRLCETTEVQPTLEAAQNKIDQLSEERKYWQETSERRADRMRELLTSQQQAETDLADVKSSLSRCQAELAAAKAELSKYACHREGVSRFALLEID